MASNRRKEKLQIQFYERTIRMLKLQAKQLRVKNTILKALLDDTIEYDYNTVLRALLVLPGNIQKASKYYKKSCRRRKSSRSRKKHQQLLTMEMKREVSRHISWKLISLGIIDSGTMVQKRYFPNLPPPSTLLSHSVLLSSSSSMHYDYTTLWKETSLSSEETSFLYCLDDTNVTSSSRNLKELEERIQRLRIILYPLLALQKKRQMEEEANKNLLSKGDDDEVNNNNTSFSSYYDHTHTNEISFDDKDDDDFLLENTSNRRSKKRHRRKSRTAKNANASSSSDEDDDDDCDGGIIKFRNNGVQFVNNFWKLLSNIRMYIPIIMRNNNNQRLQDSVDNDLYNQINDNDNDNKNTDEDNNNTIPDFSNFASFSTTPSTLTTVSTTKTSELLRIGEDDTIVRMPSDDGDALLLESILQYNNNNNNNTTTTADNNYYSDTTSKYLQLYLSNNNNNKVFSSSTTTKMVNIMNQGGRIHSIPASSVTIGDALVVILKHNNNTNNSTTEQ